MSRVIVNLVAVAIVALAAPASATYGQQTKSNQNWTGTLSITGVSQAGELFSGTKCEFSVVPSHGADLTGSSPYWTWSRITDVDVWIGENVGGANVYHFDGDESHHFTGSASFRWASTWFAHDLTVPIRAKVTCLIRKYSLDGNTKLDETTENLEVTVEPKTYNHALLYATVEKFENGSYSVDETHEVPIVAKKLINDVSRPALVAKSGADGGTTGKAYQVSPGTWALESAMRETLPSPAKGLDKRLKESTLFWVCTHGEDTEIRASHTDILTWSEIAGYVATNRTVPLHNAAVLYSCSTTSANAANAFQVSSGSNPVPDRAYIGFMEPVHAKLRVTGPNPVIRTLDLHAERLLTLLLQGTRVQEALDDANFNFQPGKANSNPPTQALNMVCYSFSDNQTRLHLVYLTPTEWANCTSEERNLWYYVVEAPELPG